MMLFRELPEGHPMRVPKGIVMGLIISGLIWLLVAVAVQANPRQEQHQGQGQNQGQEQLTEVVVTASPIVNVDLGGESGAFGTQAATTNNIDGGTTSFALNQDSSGILGIIGGAQSHSSVNSTADCIITGEGFKERGHNLLGLWATTPKQSINEACVVARAAAQADETMIRKAALLIQAGYPQLAAQMLTAEAVPPPPDSAEIRRLQDEVRESRMRLQLQELEK